MKLPFRRGDTTERTRGQALVEFAIVLPVLLLLFVLAVDFGRVFFQWVGVSNASRIGANYAARNPDAWDGTPDLLSQDEFRTLVARDLNPLNCMAMDLTEVDKTDIPDPTFTGYDVGDQTTVALQCRFRVLTPIASMILGDSLFTVTANSTFTVNGGRIAGIPVGVVPPSTTGGTPCAQVVVPNLVGHTVGNARSIWEDRFTGTFTALGGALDEDIVATQTTSPPYAVGECVSANTSVTVTIETSTTTCTSGEARVPELKDLTVGAARTAWEDLFTGAFYATGTDDEIVTSMDVSSGDEPGDCAPVSALATVGSEPAVEYCTAAQLFGLKKNAAEKKYDDALFTGVFDYQGSASGTVTGQKLTAGQPYSCSADELVTLE
ncbi:TadE/TadG family type IV pilus assembly protein [Mycobacterium sp.]|uniref:TadE/TadG family type IV pilus assembly protein n=1 Tax=Mycobacterium sp. TaxID=1785 RepID=UPI002D9E7E0A|nr:TadE/TadG family type IV pilus assembly protein [Mycobacterium sp.]